MLQLPLDPTGKLPSQIPTFRSPDHACMAIAIKGTTPKFFGGTNRSSHLRFLVFPSLYLSFLSSYASLPIPPFRRRPLKYSYRVWGSAVTSPSWIWGGATTDREFGTF